MASLTTPRPVGFPDEKRDDVHKWLLWANERLTSEALETKLHKLCEGKSKTDERNLVIEKEIKDTLDASTSTTFGGKISFYNEKLSELLNKHAPLKDKSIKIVPNSP